MPSSNKKHKRRKTDSKEDESSQGRTRTRTHDSKRKGTRRDGEQDKRISHSSRKEGTRRDRSESLEEPRRRSHKSQRKERSERRHDEDDTRERKRSRKEPKKKRDTRDRKHDRRKRERSNDRSSKEERGRTIRKDKIDTKNLCDIGTIRDAKPTTDITSSDYFSYHNHFRLYLYRNGSYFEDLSSSESKKAFQKFCAKFNDGKLEQGYYEKELSKQALEQCKRTKHSWNFKTNATEEMSLSQIKDGVRKQTEYKQKGTLQRNVAVEPTTKMKVCLPARTENTKNYQVGNAKQEDKAVDKEAMLKMFGLKNIQTGQKITIAPRKS